MISDDDLLLYHYRELDAVDRARIGAALAEQPELARRLHSLVAKLDAAAALPEVPVPAETQQRWKAALEREANKVAVDDVRASRRPQPFATRQWLVAATIAGLAILSGIQFSRAPVESLVNAPPVAEAIDPAAYERGLKWHLTSTEQTLAGLGSASPEERSRLLETIAAQNRMYALAADRAGEPQLARVLRAFAPIIDSLSQDGGDSSAALAQLSFELRVMQGRLGADAHAPAGSGPTTL
ncbi:MAG: hypothetical protein H7Y89_14570 [Steroidobacteraceae bacterium]|nr:hypothetical protein [Steroidobacteraceae bacterium]